MLLLRQVLPELDDILTMFPYTVPFGTKIDTFSAASERTMSPTGLYT